MNTDERIHVCSSVTGERWRLVPANNKFVVTSPKLLDAYVNNLRAGRLTAIVSWDYNEYKAYVEVCKLQLAHVLYVSTPDKLTPRSLVIRTGMYWNRSDRDRLDRHMAQLNCTVYDDWAP